MKWDQRLTTLIQVAPTLHPPDARFRVRPPSGGDWPTELPSGGTLPRFYALCDGGLFPDVMGVTEFFPLSQLAERSRTLEESLKAALEPDGRVSPFVPGRHLAFGWDAVGDVHLVWDSLRDELIGYMPRDDHDWHDHESGHPPSMDAFLDGVFSTSPGRIGSL